MRARHDAGWVGGRVGGSAGLARRSEGRLRLLTRSAAHRHGALPSPPPRTRGGGRGHAGQGAADAGAVHAAALQWAGKEQGMRGKQAG